VRPELHQFESIQLSPTSYLVWFGQLVGLVGLFGEGSKLFRVLSMEAYFTGLLILLFSLIAFSEPSLIPEEGYTVESVFDGNKMDVYPYSILPLNGDIVLLDSVNSTLYRIGLPVSKESAVKVFAGSRNTVPGFADGGFMEAQFNHPRGFTVDLKGNIYVADRANHAIRKISKSGVSTIAGGTAGKTGHADGPSQKALFSNDYDLTFVPNICALLVSDRGNRMIRQIKLPPGDCVQQSGSGTLWATPIIASLVSFLLGLVFMFFLQPCIAAHTGRLRSSSSNAGMEACPNIHGETNEDELLCRDKRNC